MNKLNKKGFTLIEMLVVIAIIAVLVAIIIPTISSATTKAAAAANAANLRAWKAELSTAYLSGDFNADETDANMKTHCPAPAAKKCGTITEGTVATASWTTSDEIVVKFGDYDIDDFAAVAEKGGTLIKVGANK